MLEIHSLSFKLQGSALLVKWLFSPEIHSINEKKDAKIWHLAPRNTKHTASYHELEV